MKYGHPGRSGHQDTWVDRELEEAGRRVSRTAQRLRQELDSPYIRPRRWPKAGHLEALRRSGHVRFVKEVLLHSEEGRGGSRSPCPVRRASIRRSPVATQSL